MVGGNALRSTPSRSFPGGCFDDLLVVHHAAEFDDAKQNQQKDRQDNGEFDRRHSPFRMTGALVTNKLLPINRIIVSCPQSSVITHR